MKWSSIVEEAGQQRYHEKNKTLLNRNLKKQNRDYYAQAWLSQYETRWANAMDEMVFSFKHVVESLDLSDGDDVNSANQTYAAIQSAQTVINDTYLTVINTGRVNKVSDPIEQHFYADIDPMVRELVAKRKTEVASFQERVRKENHKEFSNEYMISQFQKKGWSYTNLVRTAGELNLPTAFKDYPKDVKLAFDYAAIMTDQIWRALPEDSAEKIEVNKVAKELGKLRSQASRKEYLQANHQHYPWYGYYDVEYYTHNLPLPIKTLMGEKENSFKVPEELLPLFVAENSALYPNLKGSIPADKQFTFYGLKFGETYEGSAENAYESYIVNTKQSDSKELAAFVLESFVGGDFSFTIERTPIHKDVDVSCFVYASRQHGGRLTDCLYFYKTRLVGFNINMSQGSCNYCGYPSEQLKLLNKALKAGNHNLRVFSTIDAPLENDDLFISVKNKISGSVSYQHYKTVNGIRHNTHTSTDFGSQYLRVCLIPKGLKELVDRTNSFLKLPECRI